MLPIGSATLLSAGTLASLETMDASRFTNRHATELEQASTDNRGRAGLSYYRQRRGQQQPQEDMVWRQKRQRRAKDFSNNLSLRKEGFTAQMFAQAKPEERMADHVAALERVRAYTYVMARRKNVTAEAPKWEEPSAQPLPKFNREASQRLLLAQSLLANPADMVKRESSVDITINNYPDYTRGEQLELFI